MLDAAGLHETTITASNGLDEYLIKDLHLQGAAIDAFGVGERLITAANEPVFGGVYKIVALEKDGVQTPKIKVSENVAKTTTPTFKQVYRLYDNAGMAIADLVTLHDEVVDCSQPYALFHPEHTWKHKIIDNFSAKPMLELVMRDGLRQRDADSLSTCRARLQSDLNTMWKEVKRLENPHQYYVDLSTPLWELKQSLMQSYAG